MKKRFLLLTLTLALALSLFSPALAVGTEAFPPVKEYPGYSDVAEDVWYAPYAQLCYEVGLLEGSGGAFAPLRAVTVAQAATLAARIHEILAGGDGVFESPEGEPWYTAAVAYLEALAGEIGDRQILDILSDPQTDACREDFFRLLALVVPDGLLTPINAITSLPDLEDDDLLAFYNAGILTGVNDYGTFCPSKTLNRAEMAAMAARIVRPALRLSFVPATVADPAAGDFDPCLYLLGVPGSTPYFTCQDVTVTVGQFLPHAFTLSDQLHALCEQQGIAFDWRNSQGGNSFPYILTRNANYYALQDAWYALSDPAAFAEEHYTARKVKHILVSDQALADQLYARLQADPGQFDALMAEYSQDTRDDAGALLDSDGFVFRPGEMVEPFETAAAALAVGGLSAPVESRYGWHIILRLPLTDEDGWAAFANREAIIYFDAAFDTMPFEVTDVCDNWRRLVYGE